MLKCAGVDPLLLFCHIFAVPLLIEAKGTFDHFCQLKEHIVCLLQLLFVRLCGAFTFYNSAGADLH